MLRWFSVLCCLWFLLCATAFAEPVTLRARVEASGPAVTLGDVFDGAGDAAGQAIAPAPPPGQVATISVPVLAVAASAAGLEWAPPADLTHVRVVRPAGARATLPAASAGGEAAVRRGQLATVVYLAPGLQMTAQLRALGDGAVGQTVSFASGDRRIDAVVTGPGMARVAAP